MNTFSIQFENLLAARAGLRIRAQDRAFVGQTIGVRAQSHQMSLAHYLAFLQDGQSSEEWKKLFALLTNQESYFFRDEGQFNLLRECILPELIASNRERRVLKLWSAGCSTGEEAYSLAMTLDQLLPFRQGWKIEIRASDLSEVALQKARDATYSAWSFRNTPHKMREQYFEQKGKNWLLKPDLRDNVIFQHGNLIDDDYASHGISEIDLILCRNVFIYFEREAVAKATGKMRDALRDGGYLVTGHAELHDVFLDNLTPRNFDQSVIYQRTSTRTTPFSTPTNSSKPLTNKPAPVLPPPNSPLSNLPLSEIARVVISPQSLSTGAASTSRIERAVTSRNAAPISSSATTLSDASLLDASPLDTSKTLGKEDDEKFAMVQRASDSLRRGRGSEGRSSEGRISEGRSEILARLESLVQTVPSAATSGAISAQNRSAIFGAHCLLAQEFANSARHEKSLHHCARALEIDALSPLIYHVEARVAADCGNQERAKELFKKVVYLAPQTVSAMLELSAIYSREGDRSRAETWRKSALKALNEYSNEETLPQPLWSLDEPQRVEVLRAHLEQPTAAQPTARFAARLENAL